MKNEINNPINPVYYNITNGTYLISFLSQGRDFEIKFRLNTEKDVHRSKVRRYNKILS